MLWEVLPRVLLEIGVLPRGVLPRVLREIGGAPESAPESALLVDVNRKSTLGSTLRSTPNLPEHSREHPPGAPRFPGAPSGALPRALSRISHFSTPVTGRRDCKTRGHMPRSDK